MFAFVCGVEWSGVRMWSGVDGVDWMEWSVSVEWSRGEWSAEKYVVVYICVFVCVYVCVWICLPDEESAVLSDDDWVV
jgi:hypothetical protein